MFDRLYGRNNILPRGMKSLKGHAIMMARTLAADGGRRRRTLVEECGVRRVTSNPSAFSFIRTLCKTAQSAATSVGPVAFYAVIFSTHGNPWQPAATAHVSAWG